jgi:molybdopterin-containing oxidoreductase family iron-sulfur binding subunit
MAEKKGYNRRDFLKIIGAGAGVAATGCGTDLPEKLIPYVIQPDEVIPGVATWYSGTCGECSAGCGTLVRTREGRAVKMEGNPRHPLNQGGLCAHGQSTLQALYDPDRIREPLKRDVGGSFQAASWQENMDALAQAVADAQGGSGEVVILSRPTSGSEAALIAEFAKKVPAVKHLEYELMNSDAVDLAAERVFGPGLKTQFDFSQAQMIVSFGADFLETWLSPVEFSRGWGAGRKPKEDGSISRMVHFEPRLSPTGGNADQWIMNSPGSEAAIMLALLKLVSDRAGNKASGASARNQISALVSGVDAGKTLSGTGVELKTLEKIADELVAAQVSLIVAGGASSSGAQAVPTAVLANLLNAVLGNVGKSVRLMRTSHKASASYQALTEFINGVLAKQRKVHTLIVYGVNPAYTLPSKTKFQEALAQIPVVVSISGHMDETTELANIVLPLSHQLESWGDSEPAPGVWGLNQPAMQPLYKTQAFGDTLISLAANSKLPNAKFEGMTSFYDYIKAKWKERLGESGFEARWVDCVERGGEWSKPEAAQSSADIVSTGLTAADVAAISVPKETTDYHALVYPTVNSFDGTSANRSWMQELPNPMTTAVWGSWVEVHPQTAAALLMKNGDVIQVITEYGFVEAPVYVNKHIHPKLVAVPLGQGHTSYGRYAVNVGTNALSFLPPEPAAGSLQMLVGNAKVRPALAKDSLALIRGADYQYGRGFTREVSPAELIKLKAKREHEERDIAPEAGVEAEHEEHHGLGPRPLPKQMYAQQQQEQLPYHWGMSVDLTSCTGCGACVVACTAENNIPTVGKTICAQGRDMSWIRIERYLDGSAEQPMAGFLPMFCQHCGNAPCEPVCPVYATYHTEEGINSMVYNRCVGTRYCMNNCSYKVRHFNWFKYSWPEPLNWQLNPDVTVREVGVMEKCSFCVQRIREVQGKAKDEGRPIRDGEIQPACASSCPTKCMTFGNLNHKDSAVSVDHRSPRSYKVLDEELNTQPSVAYLARIRNEPLEA